MEITVKKSPLFDVEARFRVRQSDSVEKLKTLISEKMGIPCDDQKLMYRGQVLEEGNMSDFNIQGSIPMFVEHKRDGVMQIFVNDLHGRTITIACRPSDSVAHVKRLIKEKNGLEEESQRLIYGGKNLLDQYKLSYYYIRKESTLHLTLRLPGGTLAF